MATGRTYGAKEVSCVVGIQDISEAAIGTAPATGNFVTGTKIQMGLSSINDIDEDSIGNEQFSENGILAHIKNIGEIIKNFEIFIRKIIFFWNFKSKIFFTKQNNSLTQITIVIR